MKCKNKEVIVKGMVYNDKMQTMSFCDIHCLITNDKERKTLSLDNGEVQLTIPFNQIEKYLR